MLLHGIPPVGAKEQNTAAAPHHPHHFGHAQHIIPHMFNHFIAEDEIEAVAGKRERFADGLDNAFGRGDRLLGAF